MRDGARGVAPAPLEDALQVRLDRAMKRLVAAEAAFATNWTGQSIEVKYAERDAARIEWEDSATALLSALSAARVRATEAEAKTEREKRRADFLAADQPRHRQTVEKWLAEHGWEVGSLQWLWRGPKCFGRPYDSTEVGYAILDALTREGCTAWWGDGVSCVEQMIRLQVERAQAAETKLAASA